MNKQKFIHAILNCNLVTILTGEWVGELAYITWCDDEYVRVTPIDSDPMNSIQLKHDEIKLP